MSASGTRMESAMQSPRHSVRSSKLAAAQQCEAEADSRCVLVSASGTWVTRPCRRRPAPSSVGHLCNAAAVKRRLIEQACSCSIVRGGGGRKVRARVCIRHLGAEASPPPPGIFKCGSHLQRSRHEATTDRASLRLLHGAWRRRTQGACSCLPLALG